MQNINNYNYNYLKSKIFFNMNKNNNFQKNKCLTNLIQGIY